ncbi:hypothetical protein X975_01828, partial [Stegodyphus mimosarum]
SLFVREGIVTAICLFDTLRRIFWSTSVLLRIYRCLKGECKEI